MNKLTVLLCFSLVGLAYGLPNPLPQPLDLEHLEEYATYSAAEDVLVESSMTDDDISQTFRFDPVPFLAAEDVNIIVVDWSLGANAIDHRIVIRNTIASGEAVAAFINWLNQVSGSTPVMYHIVGHGFGGHQAGIVGRNVDGNIAYITALDPAFIGWSSHPDRFDANDGQYTEVIHTNYGIHGFLADLGHVDFYPNGGISMPGCDSHACDHARSYYYFAESITSGGFTGRQCVNYYAAIMSRCDVLPGTLQMGGLKPKIGRTGVFLLETNASSPFSKD